MLRLLIRGNSCCCRNLRIVWGSFSRPFPIVPGKKNRKDLIFFLTFPPENIPQFVYMHGGREGAQHVALCSVISYPPPMARKRSRRGGKSIRASNSSIGSSARRKFDGSRRRKLQFRDGTFIAVTELSRRQEAYSICTYFQYISEKLKTYSSLRVNTCWMSKYSFI